MTHLTNSLLQQTADGATYLQAIIMITLLVIVAGLIIKSASEFMSTVRTVFKSGERTKN